MIVGVLSSHRGAAQLISSVDIAGELGYTPSFERTVRDAISEEGEELSKKHSVVICAISGRGFFLAETLDEAVTYYNWLMDLRDRANLKLEGFEKICLRRGFNLSGLTTAPQQKEAA